MKKFMMVLFLVTFITGMFAAADFSWYGKGRIRTTLNDYTMAKAPADHWTDMRVRFGFKSDISDELMFKAQFEIGDIQWGTNKKDPETGKDFGGGDLGTDGINIETKHAYLTVNSASIPAKIELGLLYWFDNCDGLIFDNDTPGMLITPNIIKGLTLGYLVPKDEGHYDENIFLADMGVEMNEMMSFGGSFIFDYDRINKVANKDMEATYKAYITGRANIKPMENASLSMAVVYNMNKVGVENAEGTEDAETGGAFAVSLKPSFKLSNISIDGTFLYISGNDKADTEPQNTYAPIKNSDFYVNGLEIYGNGINDNANMARSLNSAAGRMEAVVKGCFKMNDMIKFWGAFGYIADVEGDETMAATEFDFGTEIKITKDLAWSVVGAMAMPNEDYYGDGTENIYTVNSALKFKLK